MKNFILLSIVILSTITLAQSQDSLFIKPIKQINQANKWEFSGSIALGALSQASGGTKIEPFYLQLAFRTGYYFTYQLEIEPEIYTNYIFDAEDFDLALSANLLYNFNIPESILSPFLLAGYGIGTTLRELEEIQKNYNSDELGGILNLGLGLKIFINDKMAIRTEYRFQELFNSYESNNYNGSYTRDMGYQSHKFMFGVSVFL
jgi:opacity protein-like surface antigen